MEKNKIYLIIGALIIAIFVGNELGFFAIFGWSNTLQDYSNQFEINYETAGSQITNAYLVIPSNTNNFSFTVKYSLGTETENTLGGNGFLSYEVFNYKTNSFETIYNKDWSLSGWDVSNKNIKIIGATIYSAGIPEHYAMTTGSCSYNRYYFCLNGMTVSEAKILSPWSEGTCSYSYSCLYPDTYLTKNNYGSPSNSGSISYFPQLITLNRDYINNSRVLFRITIDSKTTGMNDIRYSDFDIELWKINENNTYVPPVCKTSADTDCDGIIERSELYSSITKYILGDISRSEIADIIQGWSD